MFEAPWSCTISTDDSIESSRGRLKFFAFPDLLLFSFIVFSVYDRWLHSWRSNCCCSIGYQGKINSESCWVNCLLLEGIMQIRSHQNQLKRERTSRNFLLSACCSFSAVIRKHFCLFWIENNVIFRHIYSGLEQNQSRGEVNVSVCISS